MDHFPNRWRVVGGLAGVALGVVAVTFFLKIGAIDCEYGRCTHQTVDVSGASTSDLVASGATIDVVHTGKGGANGRIDVRFDQGTLSSDGGSYSEAKALKQQILRGFEGNPIHAATLWCWRPVLSA